MPSPKPSGLINIKIFVKGKELPGNFQASSLDVQKDLNRISYAAIYFLDGDPSLQKFEISEESNLDPGEEVEIKIGYDTDADSIFKGIIVKNGIKIRGGSSFTVIECKDKAVLLTVEHRNEIFEKKKDSDILKQIIQGHSGVSADVEATKYEHPQILQYDSTDWDFVVSRAELNGKVVSTIDNKVIIKEPKVAGAVLTLEYGTHILEYEADINAASQLSKVTASSWNIKKQEINAIEMIKYRPLYFNRGIVVSKIIAG